MLQGHVHPDFWPVARQFRRLVGRSGRHGAAVCVYHRGERVAHLWGGVRNLGGDPWTEDTLTLCYSTTKGVLATLAHVLVDRGDIAYDRPVRDYWPEFAAGGKSQLTVRHLLCHEAGLYRMGDMLGHARQMLDWERVVAALERSEPVHPPGLAHGYHGLTYGWLVGELLQRATSSSLAVLLDELLVRALGVDGLFIGLPAQERARHARLVEGRLLSGGGGRGQIRQRTRIIGRGLRAAGMQIDHEELEAALMPTGIEELDFNSDAVLGAVLPSINGMFDARSLARVYAGLLEEGAPASGSLLSPGTLREATRIHNCGLGRVVPLPMQWRLGYHRVPTVRVDAPRAFGHFGIGGSGGLADPDRQLAIGLVLNSGMGTPFGDTRIIRIASAAMHAVDKRMAA